MRQFFKLTASILALCLAVVSLPLSASALTSGDFEYSISADGTYVTITNYTGSDTTVTVPPQINNVDVTVIGERAFADQSTIQSITLPNTLKVVENEAFQSCVYLKSITLPESVESVGDHAFFNCIFLSNITVSPYLYSIGYQAFHNTAWLMNASDGLLFIGRVLYRYIGVAPANTVVDVPDYTAAIAASAFENQYNISQINLPVGIRLIGSFAFTNCNNLSFIRIPPTVTAIGDSAFLNTGTVTIKSARDSAVHTYASDNNLYFSNDATLNYLDGDMDKDGNVTSTDFRLLMRAVMISEECDHERFLSCDIVYDGTINTSDIRKWMIQSIQ